MVLYFLQLLRHRPAHGGLLQRLPPPLLLFRLHFLEKIFISGSFCRATCTEDSSLDRGSRRQPERLQFFRARFARAHTTRGRGRGGGGRGGGRRSLRGHVTTVHAHVRRRIQIFPPLLLRKVPPLCREFFFEETPLIVIVGGRFWGGLALCPDR